jgi:hypothetical protein
MPRMVVRHRELRRYGTRALRVGESFEASDKDARLFRDMKWADDSPLPGPTTRAMTHEPASADTPPAPSAPALAASPAPAAAAAAVAPAPAPAPAAQEPELMSTDATGTLASRRGRYRRSDMRAESDESDEA